MAWRLAYVDWVNHLVLVSDFSPEGAWQRAGGEECSWSLLSSAPPLCLREMATNLLEMVILHSGSQRSKSVLLGSNPGFSRAVFLLETPGKNMFLYPFPASRSHTVSVATPSFFRLMAAYHSDLCFLCHISFSALDSLPLSVPCKNRVITKGLSG